MSTGQFAGAPQGKREGKVSEKAKETKAIAKPLREELIAMQKKDLDEAVRTSQPFRSEEFEPLYCGSRGITISGKVSPFIADVVRELASQDMVTVSKEVEYLITAGIWERFQQAGVPNARTRLRFLMMKMAAKAKEEELVKKAWGVLNDLPPEEAAEVERDCIQVAREWNLPWPPPDESGSPLDWVVWDAFEEIRQEKMRTGQDNGRVRLREIYYKTGSSKEVAELAMARHPTALREPGSRGTIWYWIPGPDNGESSEQPPDDGPPDSRDEEDLGVANLPLGNQDERDES